jgi:general secretion pathway protein I
MSANRSSGARSSRARGFTLIEVVVAVLVLALSMSAILQLIAGGLNATRRAEFRAIAAVLALSRMDAVGAGGPIAPGEAQGEFDNGYVWRETIEPVDIREFGASQVEDVEIYRVQVSVYRDSDQGQPEITLDSLRLAPTGQ